MRQTVRFADGLGELMKDPRYVLLEVGAGQTLSTLAKQHPSKSTEQTVLASMPLAGVQELRGLTRSGRTPVDSRGNCRLARLLCQRAAPPNRSAYVPLRAQALLARIRSHG